MSIWFTADFHFNHANIIKPDFCNRPFDDVEHMNEALISNYCEVVQPGDRVYILGDFAMGDPTRFARSLPGEKFLILGNHDRKTRKKFHTCGFSWVKDVFELRVTRETGQKHYIWLSHYSHQIWPRKHFGAWHLFAHSHGRVQGMGLATDVGVDKWDYYPVHLRTLEKLFTKMEQEKDPKELGLVSRRKP